MFRRGCSLWWKVLKTKNGPDSFLNASIGIATQVVFLEKVPHSWEGNSPAWSHAYISRYPRTWSSVGQNHTFFLGDTSASAKVNCLAQCGTVGCGSISTSPSVRFLLAICSMLSIFPLILNMTKCPIDDLVIGDSTATEPLNPSHWAAHSQPKLEEQRALAAQAFFGRARAHFRRKTWPVLPWDARSTNKDRILMDFAWFRWSWPNIYIYNYMNNYL